MGVILEFINSPTILLIYNKMLKKTVGIIHTHALLTKRNTQSEGIGMIIRSLCIELRMLEPMS